MLSFLMALALALRSTFHSTLRDRLGAAPLVLVLRGRRCAIDLNLLAVTLGLLALGCLVSLHALRR